MVWAPDHLWAVLLSHTISARQLFLGCLVPVQAMLGLRFMIGATICAQHQVVN